MALPQKKNTSSITVKDAAFHWYMSRGGDSYCFVVVQRIEGHGTKLLVRVPGYLDYEGQCERPILPSLMEKCIEAAFRAGWNPEEDGPDFRVTFEGLLPDEPAPLTENELEIGELDEELQSNPNNATAYRRRGVCWFVEEEYEKAIADVSEAIQLNPGAADVLIERGESLDHKGEYDKAVADFSEAIRLDPTSALAYYHRGRSRYDRGEYDKAIEDFTESIRLDPTVAWCYPYRFRGYAWEEKGDKEKAEADLIKYEEIKSVPLDSAEAYMHRAFSWDDNNDMAIADFTEVIRLNPKCDQAYFQRGLWFAIKHEREKAIADYTEAIRLNPEYDVAYHHRGTCFSRKGEYDKAIDDHTEAIRLNRKFAKAYYSRGRCWEKKGEYDKAIDDYTEAIELDPKHAWAYHRRGECWQQKGDKARADADFKEADQLEAERKKSRGKKKGTSLILTRLVGKDSLP